jgi:hypothetical protein
MNDPMALDPSRELSPPTTVEFQRLFRRVEGWIDADLLLAEEGGPLLAEIAAAGRARDAGDAAALRRHLEGFLQALEGLSRSRELDTRDGGSALAAVRQLLNELVEADT